MKLRCVYHNPPLRSLTPELLTNGARYTEPARHPESASADQKSTTSPACNRRASDDTQFAFPKFALVAGSGGI